MRPELPPLSRRAAIANAVGCVALLLLSASIVVLVLIGLAELVRWLA